ncbi:MAG TPA: hypothetical protein VK901_17570 [Nitrospiraceae bacterium]|nr:hypothetical protein [Nitrospiraceae bacterium]
MEIEIKTKVKEEPAVRPEIQVLRAACDSLIMLDGLNPMEVQALASIIRNLSKMLPNPKDDAPAAATLPNFPPID